MRHLSTRSKLTALGAALLLVGGGAALAVEGGGDAAGDGPDTPVAADTGSGEDADPEPESDEGPEPDDGPEGDDTAVAELELEDDLDADAGDEGDDDRSATARAVHEALTGDAELAPGDPGFGHAVRDRAHEREPGEHGREVSEAARGANQERRSTAHEDGDGEPTDDDAGQAATERSGPPEGRPAADQVPPGPPEHANAGGRGN